MDREKLTPAIKRQITRDWASALPTLTVWKPMWLVRRHGPMLYGLCLDGAAQPDAYIPTVFTHCLANPFPAISFIGNAPVPDRAGTSTKVRWMLHAEKFGPMAQLLAQRHPPLQSGALGLNDLLKHYREYLRGDYGRNNQWMVGHFTAMAFSAALLGQQDVAQRVLDRAAALTRSWPPSVRTALGTVAEWEQTLRVEMKNPTTLAANVAAEVIKHKVDKLPDLGLGAFAGSLDSIDTLGA